MPRTVQNKTLVFGMIVGVIYSFLSSFVFEIIVLMEKAVREGSFSVIEYQKFSFLRLTNVISLSVFPFILIGLILVMLINVQVNKGIAVSLKYYAIRGCFTGFCAGLLMCVFSYILVLHNASFDRFLFLTFSGLVVSSFAGLAVGYQVSKFVIKELEK